MNRRTAIGAILAGVGAAIGLRPKRATAEPPPSLCPWDYSNYPIRVDTTGNIWGCSGTIKYGLGAVNLRSYTKDSRGEKWYDWHNGAWREITRAEYDRLGEST